MVDSIQIISLTKEKIDEYINVGKRSYFQHYLDFWIDGDPSPYINESFTKKVLIAEFQNQNSELFIISSKGDYAGILKIIPNQKVGVFSAEESLLVQKIYLLKESSGKGIGTEVLKFVENFARERAKKIIWLDAMVRSKAVPFYQKQGYSILSTKQVAYKTIKAEKKDMYVMVKKL